MADTNEGPEPAPESAGERTRRSRRRLWIVIGAVIAITVYALAFDYTEVDLEKTASETRQASLARIIRALAHPELTTYDTVQDITDLTVSVPCGADTPVTEADGVIVEPSCADPLDTMTVSGTGLEARETVVVDFVPESDFGITLNVARVQADDDGNWEATFEVPERESENTQGVRVTTDERVGSWGNRVEVWTDVNENGIEDDPIVPDSGVAEIGFGAPTPEFVGVALVAPSSAVTQFVSFGEGFIATDGIANGDTAVPLDEVSQPSDEPGVAAVETLDGAAVLTVTAPAGFDLTGWRAALYDGATTEQVEVVAAADQIDLSPRISDTTWETLDAIIETVFLALVATTAGLLLAVPLSFIAARNIMRDIASTVTNLALGLIAAPIGVGLGLWIAQTVQGLVEPFSGSALTDSVVIAGIALAIAFAVRWAIPKVDDHPSRGLKAARISVLSASALGALVAVVFLGDLLTQLGEIVAPMLGALDFLGSFLATLGELLTGFTSVGTALVGLFVMTTLSGRLGYVLRKGLPAAVLRPVDIVLSMAAGAVIALIVETGLDWLYRFDDPVQARLIAVVAGAVLGLVIGWRGTRTGQVNIGLAIYYIARTVFNTLRAIEPLVMAIVFVVWVGIGPFAGSLALTLHTAAALAKLYSEQVESIAAGPIEAVRATGATRLQTVVYAVVPQIIPPYISFTMYRWDINVRMSTILGFVGAGGIGFILQQNVNLLQYRSAAVQMLAIAIVVASMDYISSRLRERVV